MIFFFFYKLCVFVFIYVRCKGRKCFFYVMKSEIKSLKMEGKFSSLIANDLNQCFK